MPYLPEQYRTRLWFAIICAATGAAFSVLYFLFLAVILGGLGPSARNLFITPAFSLGAFPAAWVAWPKTSPRSRGRMVAAGLLTVFLAFVLFAVVAVIIGVLSEIGTSEDPLSSIIPIAVSSGLMILVFGTILTAGVPYLIGALMAMLFADPKVES